MSLSHPTYSPKARKLSPRDQEMLNLLLLAVNAPDGRMLLDADGYRTVYDTGLVLQAFAIAARGTVNQLLEVVGKRGGKLGHYKLTAIMDCPPMKPIPDKD